MTEHLALLLQRSGYSIRTTADFQIVRKIKETHCYTEVAQSKARLDYDAISFAANKLVKGKTGDIDGYGAKGRMGADGKDDSAG